MTGQLPRSLPMDRPTDAIDAGSIGEWDLDLRDKTARFSPRMEEILGESNTRRTWSLDEVLDRFVSEDRQGLLDAYADARAGEALEFEQRIRRQGDGAIRWLHVRGRLFSSDGEFVRCAGVAIDVTGWRTREDMRRQAEKMDAIGDLCRRIAHDYNNLLMAIGTNFELYEEQPPGSERAGRFLAAAHEGLKQGAKFNQGLTDFSAHQALHLRKISIGQLLRSCRDAMTREAGVTVKIEVPPQLEPLSCRTDTDKFRSAILNLIANARDAMPDGGTLTLSVSRREIGRRDSVAYGVSDGDYVVVAVDDTGVGIARNVFPRLFEPFFTTKRAHGSKGVGLNQVYSLVRQCGGFVTVEAAAQRGTSIRLHLPQVA